MGVLAHHVHSENIAIITILTVPWGRNGDKGGSSSLVEWGHAVSCNEVHPSLVLFRCQKNPSCRDIVRTAIIRPADSLFRSTFPWRLSLPHDSGLCPSSGKQGESGRFVSPLKVEGWALPDTVCAKSPPEPSAWLKGEGGWAWEQSRPKSYWDLLAWDQVKKPVGRMTKCPDSWCVTPDSLLWLWEALFIQNRQPSFQKDAWPQSGAKPGKTRILQRALWWPSPSHLENYNSW